MPAEKRVGADVAVTGAGGFASLPEADEAGKGACAMFVLASYRRSGCFCPLPGRRAGATRLSRSGGSSFPLGSL